MKHYDTEENDVRIIFYFITDDLRKLAYRYDIVNDEAKMYAMGDYRFSIEEAKKAKEIAFLKMVKARKKFLADRNN